MDDEVGDTHLWTSSMEQRRVGAELARRSGIVVVVGLVLASLPWVNDYYSDSVLWAIVVIPAVILAGYLPPHCYFRYLRRRLHHLTVTSPAAAVARPQAKRHTTDADVPREQLEIDFRRPDADSEDPSWMYRRVTARTNVVGLPPLRIAYFRCFGNVARTRTFLAGAWGEFGYVHMLRHPASATWRELWRWRRPAAMAELVVTAEEQLRDRLRSAPAEPEESGPFGGYPVREFFCADGFWQQAADTLLTMADLVVLDLSGITGKSLGLQFELERALSTKQVNQILVLADEMSDLAYLTERIRQTWTASEAGARTSGAPVLRGYVVDEIARLTELIATGPDGRDFLEVERPLLLGDRSESRRLLRQVQYELER